MKRFIVITFSILPVLGCCSTQPPTVAQPAASTPTPQPQKPAETLDISKTPLAFAWPPLSRATVLDSVIKKGLSAKTKYEISLAESADKSEYVLTIADFQFLEFEGRAVKGTLPPELLPVAALVSAVPPMRITKQGSYAGFPEGYRMKQIVDEMRKGLLKNAPEDVWKGLESLFLEPSFEAAATMAAGDFWRMWVESWVGFSGKPGEDVDYTSEIPLAENKVSIARTRIRNEGPDKTAPNLLRLSLTSVQDSPVLKNFTVSAILTAVAGNPEAEAVMKAFTETIETVRVTAEVFAVVHPSDLRPAEVKSKKTTTIVTKDGKKQDRVDLHDYKFEWH